MANYDNNNSGVLFKNDRKESERHPDFKGNAEVNGVEYWVSGWKKQGKSGNTFISLSFQPKEARPADDDLPGNGDEFDF